MSYMLERLTAPEPNYDYAIIYAKGVQPSLINAKDGKIRWLRKEEVIEITMIDVEDVTMPSRPTRPGPNGQVLAGELGGIADVNIYYHEEEIVRIDFYKKKSRPQMTGAANEEGKGKIVGLDGAKLSEQE